MDNTAKKDRTLLRVGGALTALIIITFIATDLLDFIIYNYFSQYISDSVYTLIMTFVPLYLVALPVSVAILGKRDKETLPCEKKPLPVKSMLLAFVMCQGLSTLSNLLTNAVTFGIDFLFPGAISQDPVNDFVFGLDIAVLFILVVIIAPIGEEFIFRRLVIDNTKKYGELYAVTLSALAFSLFHMNLYQMLYTFTGGFVYGYIYVKTGKMRYGVILHAIQNFIGGVLPAITIAKTSDVSDISQLSTSEALLYFGVLGASVLQLLLMAVCTVATVFLIGKCIKKMSFEKGEYKAKILSPMIAIFVLVSIAFTIYFMI